MGLPKRLRMGRAEYITISTRRLADMTHGATITGPDMADIILNSQLSDTEQHLSLFGSLLTVIIERLQMFGRIKRGIPTGHVDAIASDLFAIVTVNGMYRPVRRAAAVRFFTSDPSRRATCSGGISRSTGRFRIGVNEAGAAAGLLGNRAPAAVPGVYIWSSVLMPPGIVNRADEREPRPVNAGPTPRTPLLALSLAAEPGLSPIDSNGISHKKSSAGC